MNFIQFLVKSSWLNIAIATLSGLISGGCTARLIAIVNRAVEVESSDRLVLFYMALAFAALLTGAVSQFLLIRLSQDAIYKLRLRLSRNILSAPLHHLENLGAPRLLATLTDDVRVLSHAVAVLPTLCIDLVTVAGCLAYLLSLSGTVFVWVIAITAIAIWGMQVTLGKAQGLFAKAREQEDSLFQHFQAITAGTKELKLNQSRREDFLAQDLQVNVAAMRHKNTQAMRIFALVDHLGQLALFVTLGFTLFTLPRLVETPLTLLSSYALTLTYLTLPLQNILRRLPDLSRGSVALRKIESMRLALASQVERNTTDSPPINLCGRLELDGVTYLYRHQGEERGFGLGPLSLTFEPGQLTFIVGGNGSGKSTLAKLVTGLYTPDTGTIYLDGVPIAEHNREWYRQHFSAIFADFYLLERCLGCDRADIDREVDPYLKLLDLNRKVQVRDGVLSSTRLSQGQRKRLALLAAYLEDRPIYLFDEWASDQDPVFRDFFYTHLLLDLKERGKTVLVISHDNRYFHLADRIIKLDYGREVRILANSDGSVNKLKERRLNKIKKGLKGNPITVVID
jgi:putative ATP-binding cassette transporter